MIFTAAPGHLMETIALLPADDSPVTLQLQQGVYREKCVLSRPNTTIVGAGADKTRIVWGDGAYEMMPDGLKRGTFRTATLLIDGDHVTLRGVTVENDAFPREKVGQALALYVDAQDFVCEDCVLFSYQDTLFTAPLPPTEVEKNGFLGPKQFTPRTPQKHTYRRCLIRGDVDFIFGGAAAWFEDCEIRNADGRADKSAPFGGYATAACTPEGQKYGYVFHRCRFTGEDVPDGSVYLGRPWREFARTVLIDCELGKHIHPEGWCEWSGRGAAGGVVYAERGSYGAGAQGERIAFAKAWEEETTYEDFMAAEL